MYEEHDSLELKALFSDRPFQGKDPWDAKVMFVGLDANYPKTIHQDEDFMKILRIYHSAGDQYWERYKEHHPFLTEYYKKRYYEGWPYHDRFSQIKFDSTYAKYITFTELLSVPTTGSPRDDNYMKYKDILLESGDHLEELSGWMFESGPKIIFVSNEVIKHISLAKRKIMRPKRQLFDFIDMKGWGDANAAEVPFLYQNFGIIVCKSYHFSAQFIKKDVWCKHLKIIKERVDKFL